MNPIVKVLLLKNQIINVIYNVKSQILRLSVFPCIDSYTSRIQYTTKLFYIFLIFLVVRLYIFSFIPWLVSIKPVYNSFYNIQVLTFEFFYSYLCFLMSVIHITNSICMLYNIFTLLYSSRLF